MCCWVSIHVALKKALSLSKLELQDFSLAPRFKNKNVKAFTVEKNDIFLWTISTTVRHRLIFKDN